MSLIEGSGRMPRFWVYDDERVAIQRCAICVMFDERLVITREGRFSIDSSIEYHARLPHTATLIAVGEEAVRQTGRQIVRR